MFSYKYFLKNIGFLAFFLQIKNRESAARSRAKRVEQVCALETQVEQLKSQNRNLRTEVIKKAAAPPDPYTGKGIDGQPLRRTRTMPL
jgi:hypothetical protein